ncbi:MAG: hypothetical protein PHX20_05980 [Candidatus Omnitrophica bacterium]|nr:hypothetical protein [Candidatus Omnitrophota bacterium]MDD5437075.1 hypothetical protein [Candidatus Omnitrophota bacterium]
MKIKYLIFIITFLALAVLVITFVMWCGEASAVTTTFPQKAEILKDTKPAKLSALDEIWLSAEPIIMSRITRVNVLVNRLTKKVEYVWSLGYNRYIRPKYCMPNVQNLYDFVHSKDK